MHAKTEPNARSLAIFLARLPFLSTLRCDVPKHASIAKKGNRQQLFVSKGIYRFKAINDDKEIFIIKLFEIAKARVHTQTVRDQGAKEIVIAILMEYPSYILRLF